MYIFNIGISLKKILHTKEYKFLAVKSERVVPAAAKVSRERMRAKVITRFPSRQVSKFKDHYIAPIIFTLQ